jgi:exodeoxyribonuclease VII large subunit
VTQLTRRIGAALEELGRVHVEGEVGAFKAASSGHVYFDLKDLDSKIACVIWRSQVASALRMELREGDSVVVHGKLDVYGPHGGYKIVVARVERAGVGALLQKLEALKAELKSRGWFDRKRPLPAMPRTVGVVTSRDTAAFQDFLRTRSLRWPLYPVLLAHTPVQGTGAAVAIAAAIQRLDQCGVDVIVVIRGGGSLEDLWAFNELAVATAVFASRAPVVSGVGHETDVTLCDLVADVRAHTPTDAAQTVIPDRRKFEEALERGRNHLLEAMAVLLEARRERLERAAVARVLRDADGLLGARRERLAWLCDVLSTRLCVALERRATRWSELRRRLEHYRPTRQLAQRATRLQVARAELRALAVRHVDGARSRCERATAALEALSPLAVLARGYSITSLADSGVPVTALEDLSVGTELETRLAGGRARSRVTEVRPAPRR